MPKFIKATVWRNAAKEFTKISGTWRSAVNGYVKIAGVWRMGGVSPFYGSLLPGYGNITRSQFTGGKYDGYISTSTSTSKAGFQILPRDLITLPCTVVVNWTISASRNSGARLTAFVGGIRTAAGNNNASGNGTAYSRSVSDWGADISGTYTDTVTVTSAPEGIGIGLNAYTSEGGGGIGVVVHSITVNGLPVKLE